MYSEENRKYWEQWNAEYSRVWESRGRRAMSGRELRFIARIVEKERPKNLLDVGIGNGRILEALIAFSGASARIFGLDIASSMVEICRKKFHNEQKIVSLALCDLSQSDIPFEEKFDLVTMIRVLKYNENWRDILGKVFRALQPGGVYVFTMPNLVSLSVLSGDTFSEKNLPILHTSIRELRSLLLAAGFREARFQAFSKLPNFLYHLFQNKLYVWALVSFEKLLEKIFGPAFFGRELFVVAKK